MLLLHDQAVLRSAFDNSREKFSIAKKIKEKAEEIEDIQKHIKENL
jgi:hypothetical protein